MNTAVSVKEGKTEHALEMKSKQAREVHALHLPFEDVGHSLSILSPDKLLHISKRAAPKSRMNPAPTPQIHAQLHPQLLSPVASGRGIAQSLTTERRL